MPTHTRYDHAARLAVLEARGEVSQQEAVEQAKDATAAIEMLAAVLDEAKAEIARLLKTG